MWVRTGTRESSRERTPRGPLLFPLLAIGLSVLIAAGVVGVLALYRGHETALYLQEPGHELTGHRYLYDAELGWRNIPNWQATTLGHRLCNLASDRSP